VALLIAACSALPEGELPKRLVVLPAGETVRGRDGRAWSVKDREAILAQLTRPVLLDENHASVHAAPKGAPSPACGWLSGFTFTDAGLEAEVDWTPYGADLFTKKAYRFLSPALTWDITGATPTVLGTVRGLHSVGLTNDPNLDLPALNAQDLDHMNPEQIAALTAALTTAIASGFEALSAKLQPVKSEPETQVDANAQGAPAIKVAVNAVVDAAVAGGKIAPATKDAYVALGGETAESLAKLQELVKGLPPLVATNAQSTGAKQGDGPKPLTKLELDMVRAMNVTEEQFRAQRGELAG